MRSTDTDRQSFHLALHFLFFFFLDRFLADRSSRVDSLTSTYEKLNSPISFTVVKYPFNFLRSFEREYHGFVESNVENRRGSDR